MLSALGRLYLPLIIVAVSSSVVSAALLSGTVADVPPASMIDLTVEGKLDWVHWGLFTDTSLTRKATVPPSISDFTTLGDTNQYTYIYQLSDNQNGYSWRDGMSTGTVTNTTTGVWAYNFVPIDSGFELKVPADTNVNTLKLYVGAFNSRGRLVATLSDGSAPRYTNTSVFNFGNGPSAVYTLTFAAASFGQTLTVQWSVDTPQGLNANVTLQAAALSSTNANNPPYGSLVSPTRNANFTTGSPVHIAVTAADADGSVTNIELYADAAKLADLNSAPYTFTWTNAPLGRHALTARVVDNRGGGSTSRAVDVFVHTNGGAVVGSVAFPPPSVDLTGEGQRDWTHWGLFSASSFDRKAAGAQQISDRILIGEHPIERLTNYYTSFNWNDGTPTILTNGTQTGIFVTGWTNGFELSAPADTNGCTLRIYLGLYAARGNFQAYLSDASAPAYSDQSLNSVFGEPYAVYTLAYSAGNPGQALHVRFTSDESYDTDFGNVALASAALVGGPAPLVVLPPSIMGNMFNLVFETRPGINYTAEFTDSLNPTNWQTLTNVLGDGNPAKVLDYVNHEQRYYRVRMQ
jgi:hypothetical protein